MKNETSIKIPKKYQHMIEVIYHDSDGYWCDSHYGFYFEAMGRESHSAHEDTKTELLKVIRTLKPCNCHECLEVNKK